MRSKWAMIICSEGPRSSGCGSRYCEGSKPASPASDNRIPIKTDVTRSSVRRPRRPIAEATASEPGPSRDALPRQAAAGAAGVEISPGRCLRAVPDQDEKQVDCLGHRLVEKVHVRMTSGVGPMGSLEEAVFSGSVRPDSVR